MPQLEKWQSGDLEDEVFLHHLRFIAYGLGKREWDDSEVVWPGNMTMVHEPRLCVDINGHMSTIHFKWIADTWKATEEEGASFVWPL